MSRKGGAISSAAMPCSAMRAAVVDLEDPVFKASGTAATIRDAQRIFTASGLGAFAGEFFSRGKLVWTTGANEGLVSEIKRHGVSAGVHTLELWLPCPSPIEIGDAFDITAGCDKQFATCKAKFDNAERFRGFPHMPGNDFAMSYPGTGEVMDGGSRFE